MVVLSSSSFFMFGCNFPEKNLKNNKYSTKKKKKNNTSKTLNSGKRQSEFVLKSI